MAMADPLFGRIKLMNVKAHIRTLQYMYYTHTSASSPGKMSQSELCAGTIFDLAKRRRSIRGASLNARSEMNGNVSIIPRRSFGYYTAHGFEFVHMIRFMQVQNGPATRSQRHWRCEIGRKFVAGRRADCGHLETKTKCLCC